MPYFWSSNCLVLHFAADLLQTLVLLLCLLSTGLIHIFSLCFLFQAPYFWPSNCWEPENTDYGKTLMPFLWQMVFVLYPYGAKQGRHISYLSPVLIQPSICALYKKTRVVQIRLWLHERHKQPPTEAESVAEDRSTGLVQLRSTRRSSSCHRITNQGDRYVDERPCEAD